MPADPGTPAWLTEQAESAWRFERRDGSEKVVLLSDALAALEAREQQIQKALAFYADEHRWCDPDVRTCGCRFTEFCDDVANGEHPSSVARATLRELRPEGTDG